MIPDAEMLKLFLQGGSFVVMAWLVTHVFRHTLPRLAEQFDTTVNGQRKEFLEEIGRQRTEFREELHLEREAFAKRLGEIVDTVRSQERTNGHVREAS